MLRLAFWSVVLLLAGAANPAMAQQRLDAAAVGRALPAPRVADPHLAPPDFEGGLWGSGGGAMASGGNPVELQGTDGTWSVPFVHPAFRQLHCAIYDPIRQRKIVFGGVNRTLDLITIGLPG